MTNGFASKKNVMRLTLAAIVVFLARTFLDFQFVFPEMFTDTATSVLALVLYAAIFGLWVHSYLGIEREQRGWLITSLVITALMFFGLSLSTTLVYCPTPCQTFWPYAEIINWLGNISGAASILATFLYLRQKP